jgi:hypothetical protein
VTSLRPRTGSDPGRARTWLGSLLPDRNPLRRACDRAESAIAAVLLAGFLIGAPLLAIACGQWATAAALRAERAEQATRHQITAVLLAGTGSSAQNAASGTLLVEARARWTGPGGITRTGKIVAPPGEKAGSRLTIWVDASGRQTGQPLQGSDVAAQHTIAALLGPVVLGLVLLGGWALTRRTLDRRRMAAWDADWQITGPRWTSRH